ncbi:MAG: hypothetical protein EXX96DRAFT_571922 [Benjaminiella poitrasii]|nr:MAG: hypothetical protein EXX96DRAFT_571922 [Benjaminiella poitrasii]
MKWLPMPKIAHGIAIYPFDPSNTGRPTSTALSQNNTIQQQNDDVSIRTNASASSVNLDQPSSNPEDYSCLVSLEVGDEVFIIEQQGQWYRGYVLSILEEGRKPNKAPIGCFPRTHVQIKEYIDSNPDEADTVTQHRQHRDASNASSSSSGSDFDIPTNGLLRSYSEPYIQSNSNMDIPEQQGISSVRPGSFDELNFDLEALDLNSKKSSSLHRNGDNIPPPSLPLMRFEQSTVTGSSEPLVDEIAACVSEWNTFLYLYVNQRQYDTFKKVRDHINYLFQARRQLLDQALSKEELIRLRKEIVQRMIVSNLEQGQEMIVRHPEKGYQLDITNASLSTIYRMHWKYALYADKNTSSTLLDSSANIKSTSSSMNLPLDSPGNPLTSTPSEPTSLPLQAKGAKFHHILFKLKACVAHICQPGEFTELYFALYSANEHRFLTENFLVVLNYNGMPKDEAQIDKLMTLFTDLSSHDIGEGLYMVCYIVRLGGMKLIDSKDHFGTISSHTSQFFHSNKHFHQPFQKHSTTTQNVNPQNMCRRPFGCAVLKLNSSSILQCSNDDLQKSAFEYDMPIYTAVSEANFAILHEDIISNNVKEFAKSAKADLLRVSVRSFYGVLDCKLKTNAAILQGIPHTLRLGFADVAFPHDSRNDLYVKLELGDLSQLGRSRNIQVTICVRDNKSGEVIENAIVMGSGARPVSYWESMVIYHEQKPKWDELIKINIQDIHQWKRSHIFLTVKHRSSNFNGALPFNNSNHLISNTSVILPAAGSSPSLGTTSIVSSSTGGGEKILAMGFLPLFLPPLHRDFVADGSHTLHLYKYDRQCSIQCLYLDNVPWCAQSSEPFNTFHQTTTESNTKLSRPYYRNNNTGSSGKLGHRHSPSNHSFKSANSSFTSTGTPLNSVSASGSMNDIAAFQQQQSLMAHSSKLILLRDTVTLSTYLCSNKLTQNKTLVKLLNWQTCIIAVDDDSTSELLSVLDQLTFIGEIEVVKFLSDIFDALLDIMACHQKEGQVNNEINDQVLAAIVWLLGIVQDRRFSNFRPVLDVYIENRFASQQDTSKHQRPHTHNSYYKPIEEKEMTYKCLIKSLTRLCETPGDPSKAKLLRSSMKVWGYLFRFIIRSCLSQKENPKDNVEFKTDMEQLLVAIKFIMDPEHPSSMIGTQTLCLQYFADILIELQKIYSFQHVIDIAMSFVDASSHVTGRLVGFRLAMILNIVKGPTFNEPSSRLEMVKSVIRWIRLWINSYITTAKDVIFAGQAEQQQDSNQQQTRLPRSQWIENLRLSITIMSELLDRVRRPCGINSSGLTSSSISSPSIGTHSRPISFTATITTVDDDSNVTDSQNLPQSSSEFLNLITAEVLQLIPQLLNAYKDIQRLTIQALYASNNPGVDTYSTANPGHNISSRPHSRQSFSLLRERASSTGSNNNTKNPFMSPEILQEVQGQHRKSASIGNGGAVNLSQTASIGSTLAAGMNNVANSTMMSNNSINSKSTVVLKALATSPTTPFPSTYPFQLATPSSTTQTSTHQSFLTSDYAIMVSTGLLDLTVIVLELFYLTPRQQWVTFIKEMYERDGIEETADFLRKIIHTCMGILFGDNVLMLEDSSLNADVLTRCEEDDSRDRRKIPQNWLNLNAIAHQIVLCHILEPITTVFEQLMFIPKEKTSMFKGSPDERAADDVLGHQPALSTVDENASVDVSSNNSEHGQTNSITSKDIAAKNNKFARENESILLLWRSYFVGLLRVVGSPQLEVSEFTPQVQRAVWKIIGNMRGEIGARVFLSLWKLAGEMGDPVTFPAAIHECNANHHHSNQTPQRSMSDYFSNGHFFSSSPSPVSSAPDPIFPPDNAIPRKSMTFADDDHHEYNAAHNYPIRNSIQIAPTDELPLSSINEKHYNETKDSIEYEQQQLRKMRVSFLQADLAYFILSPMCAVSLTLHDRIRVNALSVIADIIVIALYSYGDFCHIQHVLISTLDRLVMSDHKSDEVICARISIELNKALEQKLLSDGRDDLLVVGARTVDSVCKFMGLLLQIRSLPSDDDEFMDERITATLKLMKFIQVIEREEIYIKYVHQMVQLHLDSRNFIEAALTLRFHTDLLQWNPNDKLIEIPELSLPVQSSFIRKEGLYMKMITYLDQGGAWELCLELCKELAYEYEKTVYDYDKLSDILQRQATFADNIVKKERCFTEYFRVGFYGRGFPASNRNRQYIYRGLEWEKMGSFIERMQNRHPNAQLLPSKMSNSNCITDEQSKELNSTLDGQYLQITSVTPIPDTEHVPCLSNPNAPDCIKKYYSFNHVSRFSFSRPILKEPSSDETTKSPESDFLNLWIEKVEFECEDNFPTIVRRSKIIRSHVSIISPIENAVTAVENKNKELISLEKKYSSTYLSKDGRRISGIAKQPINISPFSMSLNGAVDAPVNGGIPLYKTAFLSKDYWEKNPEMRQWIYRLQSAIEDQAIIIEKCLDTHKKLVSSEMRPFHSTITEFFYKNFADEIKVIKEKNAKEERTNAASSVTTDRRRSTLSSITTDSMHYSQQPRPSYDDISIKANSHQQNIGSLINNTNAPVLPAIPVMSPISRAFSIRTPTLENIPLTPSSTPFQNSNQTAFENATLSRAENLSRTLKMSLRKKSRRKTRSNGGGTTVNNNP